MNKLNIRVQICRQSPNKGLEHNRKPENYNIILIILELSFQYLFKKCDQVKEFLLAMSQDFLSYYSYIIIYMIGN